MISGSIVALVTPMFEDGGVDWESLDGLLDMHVREGTGAVVSVGTTGESATLSVSDPLEVVAHTVNKIAMFLESNPIPVKWALARQGRIGDHLRLPMTQLASAYHDQLKTALIALNLL